MKPGTPLPWKVGCLSPCRYPFYPIASGEHNVAQVQIYARGGSKIDAAYIVHAANAYPRMVEELRAALATAENAGAITALLRELGEAS